MRWYGEKHRRCSIPLEKIEDAGIGFLLRENHEIAAMALERVGAGLTQSLVNLWAFRPENEDLVEQFIEERDSIEPQKF